MRYKGLTDYNDFRSAMCIRNHLLMFNVQICLDLIFAQVYPCLKFLAQESGHLSNSNLNTNKQWKNQGQ